MKQGSIYLQSGFWKAAKKLDSNIFGPYAWELFCVLRAGKVQAEIPIDEFGQDDYLSILWHESGGSCFVEKGHIDEIVNGTDLSIEDLCSVFLLDKDEKDCNKAAQQNGMLCLNVNMLLKNRSLVSGKKISFEFHQKGNYSDLNKYFSHPCNSLLLIDPHILGDSNYIKYYIRPLLSNILPESLNVPFHISIFSGIGNGNIDDQQLGKDFLDKTDTMLKEIRPRINFSLTLFQIPIQGEGWHDRFVITNNLMIEASGGFSVFGPLGREFVAKKDCNFHFYHPLLNKNGDTDDYYSQIKKTAKESRKEPSYHHRRYGTKENRLFDLIE